MNNNPSPGNKPGGLTTILEKSLGAAAKGGTTALTAVYEYAEPVTDKGFVFMDTPGFDPVSATGQVAGGANMLCFTTGRGSAYGCKPAPVDQARHQHADLRAHDRRHGHQLRRCPRRRVDRPHKGQEIFELVLARGVRRANQVRSARLWRQ